MYLPNLISKTFEELKLNQSITAKSVDDGKLKKFTIIRKRAWTMIVFCEESKIKSVIRKNQFKYFVENKEIVTLLDLLPTKSK